ncbi:hypothetical protein ACFYNL_05960 [Streptomyces sp. NPDC007808]|uniref:hypothetical protein n=1 Tax=Streptomyces sp. NPDC007808 TaxID=3364779 RepID=UPI0036A2F057
MVVADVHHGRRRRCGARFGAVSGRAVRAAAGAVRLRQQPLWFLGPFRTDEWLLHDQVSPSAEHGRALTCGRLLDKGWRLVAALAQEGPMRFDRPRTAPGRRR